MKDDDLIEQILKKAEKADLTVEYLFIEKAEKQEKLINDNQAYSMGFINFFKVKGETRDSFIYFKELLEDELNYTCKSYDHFNVKSFFLNDYKYIVVDKNKKMKSYSVFNRKCFNNLLKTSRNLLIVGKNFNFEHFKQNGIFNEWFEKFCNK
ncbi:MAG: hypothetical protein EAX96_01995 [Candidatus Lokiarchaeota archaeon]|nr:hypothetical protein [Candidatus Lokiarchaeota archaeon]